MLRTNHYCLSGIAALAAIFVAGGAQAQTKKPAKKTSTAKAAPAHAKILSGYTKVVSTADGKKPMYTIWVRKKDSQMVAELPANFASKKYFIGLTVSSGERFAGLQARDMYVYWRKFDKRLALIEPNIGMRSTGDRHSKASIKRLFTDRVLLDVPILGTGPSGGPLIDMDNLLVAQAPVFFGPQYANRRFSRIFEIKKAKAFPQNVELAFEFPTVNGRLQTLHYSISVLPSKTGYKPRVADQRIGYFTTSYTDLGKYSDRETKVRYINRWHLQKADPKLKISPPVEPIVFYIEHTTPVRYRRWVEKGVLDWNKAFRKVGLHNAVQVRFQDAKTGAFMDLDPEDVRYNFIRWLNNDVGTAIGPSRVNPETGQILDADIILTDGWIRHYRRNFSDILPKVAMEGFDAETLSWLTRHPQWDPRLRLAAPSQRDMKRREILRESLRPFAGHALARNDTKMLGDEPYDGLLGRTVQVNGRCDAASGMAMELSLMRLHLSMFDPPDEQKAPAKKGKTGAPKNPKKKGDNLIDGMPESFIGPLVAHLVAHEVGHTLGLRHNFKGSSLYSLNDINSAKVKGKKTLGGSVMDYTPININFKGGKIQGDWAMQGIGPYDLWAIEYGYSFEKDLKPILARVAEPQLQYGTDEDAGGPDPLVRRFDFSKNPLDYARDQLRLINWHRSRIVGKFVKKGDSWDRARAGYELTLSIQMRAVSMMANWIGGAHVYRDKKGDKNGRPPISVVTAKEQRAALKFVVDTTFRDKAFGLSPDLLKHMTVDKWMDSGNYSKLLRTEAAWPVHDKIMGLQASALTMVMRPTTLRRVYDNEFRVPAQEDALTLPELMQTVRNAIWSELDQKPNGKFSARTPMISSLRRNLQREHLKRLIDLTMPNAVSNEAGKPIANIARQEMRTIAAKTEAALKNGNMDPYSRAHLTEVKEQVAKALDARYIYNTKTQLPSFLRFGRQTGKTAEKP
ncbi:MAG: zinc-dependent metalloprotease [Planctomycetaceae bacterium]